MKSTKPPKTTSKIRLQLAGLVLAAVLPVWLLSGFLVYHAYGAKRDQANQRMLESAHALAMTLDRDLSSVQAALQALATSPAFATGDFASVRRQALQLTKAYPGADIIVADLSGQQVLNSARPYGTLLPRRNNAETVRRIFSTGKPVIGDQYYGALTKRALISIDIPVMRGGRVAYDLAMTFPSDRLASVLLKQALPPDCYGVILDSKPVMVARSRYPDKYLGKPANAALQRAMARAPEGIAQYTNVEGTPTFAAFSRSSISPWSVVVAMPKASVMAGIYQWVTWALAGSAAISLFGIFLAFAFGRRIARAEEAVSRSEAQYRTLFDTMTEGFCIIEVLFDVNERPVDYRFLEINPAFERQTGLHQAQGKLMRDLAPEHEAHWFEIYGKVALTGEPTSFIHEARALGRWYDVSAYRVGGGESRKVAIIFNDISETKRSEEALQESERRYSALFANKINGMAHCRVITDAEGRPVDYLILQVNDAYQEITGVQKTDIEGRRVTEVFPGIRDYAFDYIGTYGRIALEGGEIKFEEYFEATGQYLSVYAYSPLPGEFSAIFTDVSEHKQAEENLQKAHDELERRVEERTRELATALHTVQLETAERIQAVEALREKEQMLIQQSRQAAMGEMIGNIAHQWRQPLNLLGLTAQQLLMFYDMGGLDRTLLENTVQKQMGIIQHMSQTIDDFRNYFRPDKEKSDFQVEDSIGSTLSLLKGSLQDPQIDIKVVTRDNPVVHGYPNEFAQVLLNIVVNAKDVLTERKIDDPWVVITAFQEGGSAVVTIADNGGGIPEEIMGKIFDPYFTTKGPLQGTGVGLFMSKSIIEKNMGGRLAVRNTPDGAEFRIEVGHGPGS